MIPGNAPYGWGVSDLPMPRPVRSGNSRPPPREIRTESVFRLLRQDTPWLGLFFSAVMTALSLVAIALFARQTIDPKPPSPVQIAVLLLENPPNKPPLSVPAAPQRKAIQRSPKRLPSQTVRTRAPDAARAKKPQHRRAASRRSAVLQEKVLPERTSKPASSPPTIQFRQEPAAMVPLPRPVPAPPHESSPAIPAPLPKSRLHLAEHQDVSLQEISPRRPRHQLRQRAALPFAEKHEDFTSSADPGVVLGNRPDSKYRHEFNTIRPRLPASASVNLSGPTDTTLPSPAAKIAERADHLRHAVGAPGSLSLRETHLAGARGDPTVTLPDAEGSRMVRKSFIQSAALPEKGRIRIALAQSTAGFQPSLPGPRPGKAAPRRASSPPPGPDRTYDYLDRTAPADLDPSVRMRLNRLRTCLDPEKEKHLKSRLAAMLHQPTACRTGGVVFSIRFPESAYSIHIDLYNYERRVFPDRCAALSLAIESCEVKK